MPNEDQLAAPAAAYVSDGPLHEIIVETPVNTSIEGDGYDDVLAQLSEAAEVKEQQKAAPATETDAEVKPAEPGAETPDSTDGADKSVQVPEGTTEKPDGEKPAETPATSEKPDDIKDALVPDKDEKYIPRRASAKLQKLRAAIPELQARAAQAETAKAEFEKQVTDLRTQLETVQKQGGQAGEDATKRLERLAMFERRYELENSTEFQSQFIEPQRKTAEDAVGLLTQFGLQPEKNAVHKQVVDTIREYGLHAFREANPQVYGEIIRALNTSAPEVVAELAALAVQSRNLDASRANFITTETSKAQEYFTKQAAAASRVAVKAQESIATRRRQADETYTKLLQEPHLAIPADAKPEVAKRVEELRTLARVAIEEDSPEHRANIARLVVASQVQVGEIAALKAERDSLKAELAKVKSSKTVPQSGKSAAASPSTQPKQAGSGYVIGDEGETDWEAFVERLQGGGSVREQ